MRNSESVTFGGSGLDRAAHLRGDGDAIAALWARDDARVLPIWRGKPLIGADVAIRLPVGHKGLGDAINGAVFWGWTRVRQCLRRTCRGGCPRG